MYGSYNNSEQPNSNNNNNYLKPRANINKYTIPEQQMSSWLNQSQFVQNLAQNMLSAKRTYYQQDYIKYKTIECNNFNFKNMYIKNKFNQKIKTTVFSTQEENQCCILYLHGFGSHRLEGTTILSSIPTQFALCCFDFSGSGKSEGNLSTYGIKEYLDIKYVIDALKQQYKFKKFVLWGRSMGAVASLLYTSSPSEQINKQDILFQVLDSPFSSFESIAKHHAIVSYKFPQLFIDFGLGIVKEHFKNNQFNPFLIDVVDVVKQCEVPALFVYSQDDNIIPVENSINIINHFNTRILYEKLLIPEGHNNFRTKDTLDKIVMIVKKYVCKNKIKEKIKYKRGIHQICSNPTTPKDQKHQIKITKLSGCHNKCGFSQKKKIVNKSNPEEYAKNHQFISCFKNCSKPEQESPKQ